MTVPPAERSSLPGSSADVLERLVALEQVVFGNDRAKLPGMLSDLREIRKRLDRLDKIEQRLLGVAIGLSITGVGTLATAVTLIVRTLAGL